MKTNKAFILYKVPLFLFQGEAHKSVYNWPQQRFIIAAPTPNVYYACLPSNLKWKCARGISCQIRGWITRSEIRSEKAPRLIDFWGNRVEARYHFHSVSVEYEMQASPEGVWILKPILFAFSPQLIEYHPERFARIKKMPSLHHVFR